MTSAARPLDARHAGGQARSMLWVAMAGPSGAGKDSLLAGAQALLAGDGRIHFARRTITRPADAGGEAHEHLPDSAFDAAGMVLQWRAHGWRYGIRATEVRRAPVTVLSLSRTVLEEAARLAPLLVVEVWAPPAVLAARLAVRGREDAAAIEARLSREAPLPPGLNVRRLVNDGPLEEGAARLAAWLRACAEGAFPP